MKWLCWSCGANASLFASSRVIKEELRPLSKPRHNWARLYGIHGFQLVRATDDHHDFCERWYGWSNFSPNNGSARVRRQSRRRLCDMAVDPVVGFYQVLDIDFIIAFRMLNVWDGNGRNPKFRAALFEGSSPSEGCFSSQFAVALFWYSLCVAENGWNDDDRTRTALSLRSDMVVSLNSNLFP